MPSSCNCHRCLLSCLLPGCKHSHPKWAATFLSRSQSFLRPTRKSDIASKCHAWLQWSKIATAKSGLSGHKHVSRSYLLEMNSNISTNANISTTSRVMQKETETLGQSALNVQCMPHIGCADCESMFGNVAKLSSSTFIEQTVGTVGRMVH